METVRQTKKVPKNHEVKIKIPDTIKENESVEIVLITGLEDKKRGLEELKKAMEDKLFLEDLNECMDDFKYVDAEYIDKLLEIDQEPGIKFKTIDELRQIIEGD